MGGKQIGIIVVCLLVIGAAVTYTIKSQKRTSDVPPEVAARKSTYICAKCNEKAELTVGEWQGLSVDKATGLRKCPKCSEMGLSTVMACAQCGATIPERPQGLEGIYLCPKCGKDAMAPPAPK